MDITQHKDKKACSLEEQIRHFLFWEGRGLVNSMLLWCHNCQRMGLRKECLFRSKYIIFLIDAQELHNGKKAQISIYGVSR